MKFFRNPEIKKTTFIYILITFVAFGIGFWIDMRCAIFAVALSVIFSSVHLMADFFRYKKLSDLSDQINEILHGQDKYDLSSYAEGELAILQSQIFKMTIQLREQATTLKKDKVYLTDSIADISHQIKTPLTSINLIASLLSELDIEDERRMQLTSELMRMLSHVEWLITTLLKMSKFDAGTVEFQNEVVKVDELIREASSIIAIPMDLRDQIFVSKILPKITFKGDLAWSVEAIGNILKNCMEHTPKGGQILVSAEENAIYSEIMIIDNGVGIAKEDLPHVFERFYKGKNSSSQSVGIGLALAKMIVARQNGTIKVENNQAIGAKFTIRFYKGIV
ncbi:sensor histidine kinase [[Clostridium] fimetarium]|uniref:histidine kinase n=1 Tax=[Clostridium] fimetarium TaxID=99656 RepID=A0A1I0QYW7_9FIRM|nr:HAMP domain-containing sensor histidine kinase [[Clostridium] fimetarium]SEW33080.1 Signal transduction histidine kinase [[Clostridium] fimetarium]